MQSLVNLVFSRVLWVLRRLVFTEEAFELLHASFSEGFRYLEVARAVHVARAEAAEDGEEVDLADLGQRKEEIKGEVAAAEVHELDSLRENLLDDVETAVG